MLKKMIIVGVLLLAGCASPVRHLRDISTYAKCRERSYKIKTLLWEIQNASFIGDSVINRPFIAPVSEIQVIAKELKRIDRKFRIVVTPDSIYTTLTVRW